MTSGSRDSVSRAPATAPAIRPGEPLLAVADLRKSFGPTQALQECSFNVRFGEVHAIVGENGSGKSTLVKILAGVHRPDAGMLEVEGRRLEHLRSPRATRAIGLVAVFQEVLVVGPQSMLDNVWLGTDGLFRARVGKAAKRERASAVLRDLLGEVPSLDTPVELLPLSMRQVCGIARALVRDPRILILDESTSALDVATRDRLFTIVRRLTAAGGSVIFISHRMDEIEEIADRITVLRSGRSVATLERGETSAQEVVRLMSGADHLTTGGEPNLPASQRLTGASLLQARGVRLREGAAPIDFTLAAGEVVGLAGLEGHGQDAFVRALCGGPHYGEIVRLDGDAATVIRSPEQAAEMGVVYVPRDRRTESLFPTLSIRDNFAAPTFPEDQRLLVLRRSRTDARLFRYRDRLAIKLASASLPITTLSGGNQQKIVMARWLAVNPRVLLLNDPTRGVDLNAKRDLYRLLWELADGGVAVVMLSSEVDELIELMDRVLVFREGSVFTDFDRNELSREALVASFFGQQRERHAQA
ncbi:MAG: sugar ABC transporter ATP-binding protein [Solirubrobacterales bacterium]|nr:sugar ABC transporter ATP-binding protein [Solirubrobacterales bacterium]